MPRQVFQALVPAGLIALLSVALLGGYLTTCRVEWLQLVAVEIQVACRDCGARLVFGGGGGGIGRRDWAAQAAGTQRRNIS